jgi:hypothetical protein
LDDASKQPSYPPAIFHVSGAETSKRQARSFASNSDVFQLLIPATVSRPSTVATGSPLIISFPARRPKNTTNSLLNKKYFTTPKRTAMYDEQKHFQSGELINTASIVIFFSVFFHFSIFVLR